MRSKHTVWHSGRRCSPESSVACQPIASLRGKLMGPGLRTRLLIAAGHCSYRDFLRPVARARPLILTGNTNGRRPGPKCRLEGLAPSAGCSHGGNAGSNPVWLTAFSQSYRNLPIGHRRPDEGAFQRARHLRSCRAFRQFGRGVVDRPAYLLPPTFSPRKKRGGRRRSMGKHSKEKRRRVVKEVHQACEKCGWSGVTPERVASAASTYRAARATRSASRT